MPHGGMESPPVSTPSAPDTTPAPEPSSPRPTREEVLKNAMAGLTTSFVVVSLGAAFGVMSGRGAFAGMISAAIIGIVVSLLGGTRVAVSGPTGPMTAVTATAVAFAYDQGAKQFPQLPPEQFVSIILIGTSALILLLALLRLGRLIHFIPQVVISGFMNGIAVLIWLDVVKRVWGTETKPALTGSMTANLVLLFATFAIAWKAGPLLKKVTGRWSSFFPATLVAIVLATGASLALGLQVERTQLAGIKGLSDLVDMAARFVPRAFPSGEVLMAASWYIVSLALLNYLDTLMTALVMDKLTGNPSKLDRELFGQGVSMLAVVPFGGIPGAQATIRSVLLFKEGATLRWAGTVAGAIALVQVLVFQDAIGWIPQAVFMGILVKVGVDVFDWGPPLLWLAKLRGKESKAPDALQISHTEMLLIAGTTGVTIAADLNIAVACFTAAFYLLRKGFKVEMLDLHPPAPATLAPGAGAAPTAVPELSTSGSTRE